MRRSQLRQRAGLQSTVESLGPTSVAAGSPLPISPATSAGDRSSPPLVGRRLLRGLEAHLRHLHRTPARAATAVHGNRELHLDHLVVAHLAMFFNPTVNSLRTLEDAFEDGNVRRRFGLPRVKRSTVSDAQRVFDPAVLQPILADLGQRVRCRSNALDPRLEPLLRELTAVDSSYFEVAARILWARPRHRNSTQGAVQLCLHYDVLHGAPAGFTLIDGGSSERAELPSALRAGQLYLLDRAYKSYDHLNQVVALDSDFVVRLRASASFTTQGERPLNAEDRLAGVLSDREVQPSDRHYRFAFPVRLVELRGADPDDPVRLLTNRTDLSAAQIGLLYRYRWQIELFFRWLKCVVGFQHFTSESREGMTLQLYVVLIGTLLIELETGHRATKYDFNLLCLASNGFMSHAAALRVAARRRAERERDRLRQRAAQTRRAAEKKSR